MRILFYILELFVFTFIVVALIFISRQERIDEAAVEQEVDSTASVGLDRLNDTSYIEKFETDSLANTTDSLAKQ